MDDLHCGNSGGAAATPPAAASTMTALSSEKARVHFQHMKMKRAESTSNLKTYQMVEN
jgi:hypothetical protein